MERIKKETAYYTCMESMLRQFHSRGRQDVFYGNSADEHRQWQKKERAVLKKLVGLDTMQTCSLSPELKEQVQAEPGITREKVLIQVEPGVWMPFFILIPDQIRDTETPCVLALPGHLGGGKYSVAGVGEYGAVAEKIEQFHYDYGLQMARAGYVVFCPDCRGFGERREAALQQDTEEAFLNSTCFQLAHMAESMGQTVIGQCTWDGMRLIDYIQERGEWPSTQVGCIGFSGGGMQTLWLSALDDRVGFSIISGYMYGYADSLLKLNGNCSCNYVPHLYEHVDMGDIGSLIAPRPVLIQSCVSDNLNGERGIVNAMEQVAVMREAYALYGAENVLVHDTQPGGHCFHWEPVPAFLQMVENFEKTGKENDTDGMTHPDHISNRMPVGETEAEDKRVELSAGTGCRYATIAEALAAAADYPDAAVTIHLAEGIYQERLVITQENITFLGENPAAVIIRGGLSALEVMADGENRGTFRTGTVRIAADGFCAKNVTFENTAGPGQTAGQALALYVDADRVCFENCHILGGQDTLFAAPLPPKVFQKNGFRGPGEFTVRKNGRHLYRNCIISGDVDFIFGGAVAWFEGCTIISNDTGREINGYVTAASTPEGLPYGFVFHRCSFQSEAAPNSVYLGRPWRQYAKTVILECKLGAHIREEGWMDWGKPHETFFYAEYGNYGPGADTGKRADFVKLLTREQAAGYTMERVLGDWVR